MAVQLSGPMLQLARQPGRSANVQSRPPLLQQDRSSNGPLPPRCPTAIFPSSTNLPPRSSALGAQEALFAHPPAAAPRPLRGRYRVPLRTTAPWTYPVGSTCTSWGRKRFGSPDPCAIFPLVRVPGHDAPLHALLAHHSPETNRSGSTLRSGPVQEKRTGPRRTRRARSACARRRGRLASRTGSRTRRSTAGRRRTGRSSPARSVPPRIAHPALLEVEEVVRAEHPDATGGGGHAQVLAAPHRHRSSVLSGGIPAPSGRGPIAAVLAATWCPARASRERVARRGRRGAARRSAREGVGSPTAPGGRCSALTGRALPAAADARTCGTGSPRWRSSPGSHQCEAAPVCCDRGCFAGLRSWWPGAGSNRRPSAFQADARTN